MALFESTSIATELNTINGGVAHSMLGPATGLFVVSAAWPSQEAIVANEPASTPATPVRDCPDLFEEDPERWDGMA